MEYLPTQKRQILVYGYVREQEQLLKLSNVIPVSIIPIIFEYQLFVETWNKAFSHPEVSITDYGSCLEIKGASQRRAVYGNHIVKYGESFTWNMKIISGTNCKILVGLIPNNKATLLEHRESYNWHKCNGYVWCAFTGQFAFSNGQINQNYSTKCFKNEHDALTIQLNLNECSLHFIYNGTDLGNALRTYTIPSDESTEFRLALCVEQQQSVKIIFSTDDL